jgi:hypothetical protein
MLRKITSILGAAVLATGISIVVAPSANAFASNAGAVSAETRVFVQPDVNGNFTLPAGVVSLSAVYFINASAANAAGFSSKPIYLTGELKNPSNQVITSSIATAAGLSLFGNAFWTASSVNGNSMTLPSTVATIGSNNTMLTVNAGTGLTAQPGSTVPAGTYNFTAQLFKDGTAYTPSGTDSASYSISYVLEGSTITNPGYAIQSVSQNLVTCVNSSLVTSSDTLTLNLVASNSTSDITSRFFAVTATSASLSSTSTLSLSGVDLSTQIAVSVNHYLPTTQNLATTTDLSVTKGDGTEVSTPCLPGVTPAAPNVSFSSSTTLVATFTVSNASAFGQCFAYLTSAPNTAVKVVGSSGSGTTKTCTFTGLTSGESYIVKAREYRRISFSQSIQNQGNFYVYRSFYSGTSPASTSVTSSGGQSNSQVQLTAEQIAAAAAAATLAAAIEAERVRVAAIVAAQVALQGLLKGDKPGTMAQYKEADFTISSEAALARVNAALLKLPADLRVKNEEIAKVVKIENLVDQISTTATQKKVTVTQLISTGFLAKENNNKSILTYLLKNRDASSLGSKENIAAVIAEETEAIKARAARLAAIKAKIAARNK